MISILFVCHGNICRSPMAEFVMKDMVKKRGAADEYAIASAAVSREEVGSPVYPPAARVLARHGIPCAGHSARQMTRADYERYDLIVCMDRANIRGVMRIAGGDPKAKLGCCSTLPKGRGRRWRTRGTRAISIRPGATWSPAAKA